MLRDIGMAVSEAAGVQAGTEIAPGKEYGQRACRAQSGSHAFAGFRFPLASPAFSRHDPATRAGRTDDKRFLFAPETV